MYQQNKPKKIKRKIGQVNIQEDPKSLEVVGMDQNSHVLKSAIINENQIVGTLTPLVQQWANWILQFLSSLPITMQRRCKNSRNHMLWWIHVIEWTTFLSTKHNRMSNLCHRRSNQYSFCRINDSFIPHGRLSSI